MLNVLLWCNDPNPYRQALERAGLADRLRIETVRQDGRPGAQVLEATGMMLAYQVPAGALTEMPKLRWVQAMTVGIDNWLVRPDLRTDIVLTCARGTHRVSMPENILGALFHITKPYTQAAIDQRDRRWVRHVSTPLAGKTLAILGLGAIGAELARKAAALEIRVIGTKRSPEPVAHVERVYPPEAIDEVLGQADFVLLLLPLTPHTDRIMNAQRFKSMRPDGWLLNFGRGGLVDDDDLVAAVRAKTIAGAVLDVYRQEPLPVEHVFWGTEGILVLPHIGGLAPGRDDVVAAIFADNMRRFLAGEPLAEVVDRARGY